MGPGSRSSQVQPCKADQLSLAYAAAVEKQSLSCSYWQGPGSLWGRVDPSMRCWGRYYGADVLCTVTLNGLELNFCPPRHVGSLQVANDVRVCDTAGGKRAGQLCTGFMLVLLLLSRPCSSDLIEQTGQRTNYYLSDENPEVSWRVSQMPTLEHELQHSWRARNWMV